MVRAAVLVLVLVAGCSKSSSEGGGASAVDAGPNDRKSLTPEEVGQGMQLCRGYVQRLCRCAQTDKSFADECDLAKSQPEGLAMTVKYLAGSEGPISKRERLEAEAGARKIIAACVRADGALDPAKCPR
jgi:hypothetical protein